jgi:hypothetical protein
MSYTVQITSAGPEILTVCIIKRISLNHSQNRTGPTIVSLGPRVYCRVSFYRGFAARWYLQDQKSAGHFAGCADAEQPGFLDDICRIVASVAPMMFLFPAFLEWLTSLVDMGISRRLELCTISRCNWCPGHVNE